MESSSLDDASTALAAGDLTRALEQLLLAWRQLRHPRVADVIDRVSAELTAQRGPVAGKTLAAQVAALAPLHEKKDPADLGRVLSQRWPGTWQKGLPLLRALFAWPEDPRLERAFAALIGDPPYTSQASYSFFTHLLPRLRTLTDTRCAPLLLEAQTRHQQYWYRTHFAQPIAATLARLQATTPAPLTPADEAALLRLEQRYADAATNERDRARGAKELLDDIHARPRDLQARAVFADWLTEHADPRGEAITLQLSDARTRPQEARLNALLKKHGAAWAGVLDEWLEPEERVWEAGFVVGGRLLPRAPRPFTQVVGDDAWRLMRVLEFPGWGAESEATFLAAMPALEVCHGLSAESFLALARGPRRPLRELSIATNAWWGPVLEQEHLTEGSTPGLDALETLGLAAVERALEWLRQSPVSKRLRRVRLRVGTALGACVAFVRDALPNVVELEVLEERGAGWLGGEGWRVTFHRDGPGPFTRVTGAWFPSRAGASWAVGELDTRLSLVDLSKLTSVTLTATKPLLLKAEQRTRAANLLAKLAHAKVEVPWETAVVAPAKPWRAGPEVELDLHGDSLLGVDAEQVFETLVTKPGLLVDSYSVGYGNAHRALGPKPVETLGKWGKNARCETLRLYEDGGVEELTLTRGGRGGLRATLLWNGRGPMAFVDWLCAVLDTWPFASGSCGVGRSGVSIGGHSGPPVAWLTIFSEAQRALVPAASLRALSSSFDGLFVRETKRNLVLGRTLHPAGVADAQALADAVFELVEANVVRVLGVDVLARATEVLAPVAATLGLPPLEVPRAGRSSLCVRWGNAAAVLEVELFNLLGAARVRASLQPVGQNTLLQPMNILVGEQPLEPALGRVVAELLRDGPDFLADPKAFYRRRR